VDALIPNLTSESVLIFNSFAVLANFLGRRQFAHHL
jgi:hypothetical protein